MAIPLLGYPLNTQNGRFSNLAGDNSTIKPQTYASSTAGDASARTEMDSLIEQAYRQVFFHAMRSDREPFLESQLRSGNITVRDFIQGCCCRNASSRATTSATRTTGWWIR